MNVHTTLTLSTTLNADTFCSLTKALDIPVESDDHYTDTTKRNKGMVVTYHAGLHKKRISVLFDLATLLPNGICPDSLLKKVHKRLQKYFRSQLSQLNFFLSSATIAVNLRTGHHNTADDYLTVLRRIGKVKGYMLQSDCSIGGTPSYLHWIGNSNATALRLCNLTNSRGSVADLRAEVQLRKSKAIYNQTEVSNPEKQMVEVATQAENVFLGVFSAIIPYGAFLKQQDAIRLIQTKVPDARLREKMWRLVSLIPEKKSLLGAQKAAGYRNTRDLMEAFADIDLSPITIAKRHPCPQLPNIYALLVE